MLNGAATPITVADKDSLTCSGALTISAWIKPTTLSTDWDRLLLKWGTLNEYHFALNNKRVSLYAHIPSDEEVALGSQTVPLGTWSHVAATWNGASGQAYFNGVEDGAARSNSGSIANTSEGVCIGDSYSSSSRQFNGVIDEVRVENAARSSNWLWAEWMNMASNTVFNSYGTVATEQGNGLFFFLR